jgi:hypothetical protein
MISLSQVQVADMLGLNVLALWSLSGNPQFPAPVSSNDQGLS